MLQILHRGHIRSFYCDTLDAGGLAQHAAGVRTIPIDQIVGSVGRAHELRPDFRPVVRRRGDMRYEDIQRLLEEGAGLPAITVYEFRDRYYVVDGHHRVAAARKLGQVMIDAEITEFRESAQRAALVPAA